MAEKDAIALAERQKQLQQISETNFVAIFTLCYNQMRFQENPVDWITVASFFRFCDKCEDSKWVISKNLFNFLQYTTAISCFMMLMVSLAPQKFEKAFSPFTLGCVGVITAVLVRYVFIDLTLIFSRLYALVLCSSTTPFFRDLKENCENEEYVKNKKKELIIHIKKERGGFPSIVQNPSFLLITTASAVFIAYFFPLMGYVCMAGNLQCSFLFQIIAFSIEAFVLLILTFVFGYDTAIIANGDIESEFVMNKIQQKMATLDVFNDLDVSSASDEASSEKKKSE